MTVQHELASLWFVGRRLGRNVASPTARGLDASVLETAHSAFPGQLDTIFHVSLQVFSVHASHWIGLAFGLRRSGLGATGGRTVSRLFLVFCFFGETTVKER